VSKACLLDTNVLVRFLTGEPPPLARRARAVVAQADNGTVELQIPSLILAETVDTLESFYEMPKTEICEKLSGFLRGRGISPLEREIILDALERYRTKAVHFADAYLAAHAAANNVPVFSFDADFRRFQDIDWKH
jgi:predicted nucleic acid-binding protein